MKATNKIRCDIGESDMDEFLTEIRSNIINSQIPVEEIVRPSRFRELFAVIMMEKPEIKIIDDCTEDGDIRFEVSLKSLGLSTDVIKKYRAELSTDFAANFIGEILVRENIAKFVKILINLKENYGSVVNKYDHRKFGMIIRESRCIFALHSSLIQSILMEDIKNEMKRI
jgi:hypothetical protein